MHEISVFERGFSLKHNVTNMNNKPPLGVKRGKIKGWSRKSRGRLRKSLLEYSGSGVLYGITSTLPYKVSLEDWYLIVKRYRKYLTELGCAGIYRVELQKNKNPHLHLVIWSSCPVYLIWDCWIRALALTIIDHDKYGFINLDRVDGALIHSCFISLVDNSGLGAYRYICDHASKHKQAQLGYVGRQWGFINKKLLHSSFSRSFFLSDYEFDWVLRLIRRLSHCRVSRGNGGRSVWFTRPETLSKIVSFVLKGV